MGLLPSESPGGINDAYRRHMAASTGVMRRYGGSGLGIVNQGSSRKREFGWRRKLIAYRRAAETPT